MKLSNWIRFRWDLTQLPEFPVHLPEHYEIGFATAEEETELRKIITSSFVLDSAWNPSTQNVMETIEPWLERAFASPSASCLALRHGSRIIGAAVVCPSPEAEIHLAPGPCVSMEYRNRGFGTRLLEHSLKKLAEAGLAEAFAATQVNTPVAKFLYPKFDGRQSPYNPEPVPA